MSHLPKEQQEMLQHKEYPLERRRYVVLGVLWVVAFLFWMGWTMQGPLLVSYWGIQQHVAFSSAVYLLTAMTIVGIFTSLPAGKAYDRLGPKKATAVCLAFITVGFGLRPFVTGSFAATLALTIVAGIGVPIIIAPTAIAAQWFGRHRMNLPLAVGYSSFAVGQTAGLLLGARMNADLGIVWTFGIVSIALVAAFILWWVLVPEAPKEPAGPPAVESAPVLVALREVVRAQNAWTLFILAGVISGAAVFAQGFLPGWLHSTFNISFVQAGDSTAVFSGAGFFGMLLIGYLARRSSTTRGWGLFTSVILLASWLALTVLWYVGVLPLWGAILLLAIGGFVYGPSYNCAVTALERAPSIRPETVGVAAGFFFTGSSIGTYLYPTVIAKIVDSAGPGAGLVWPLVLLAIGTALWISTFGPQLRARRAAAVADRATVGGVR